MWRCNYKRDKKRNGGNYSYKSELIQECGRLCERYASDLFIDWQSINEKIENKTMTTSTYLFGNNKQYAYYEYRKIYRLDVVVENDGEITMKLAEISKPFSERRAD